MQFSVKIVADNRFPLHLSRNEPSIKICRSYFTIAEVWKLFEVFENYNPPVCLNKMVKGHKSRTSIRNQLVGVFFFFSKKRFNILSGYKNVSTRKNNKY